MERARAWPPSASASRGGTREDASIPGKIVRTGRTSTWLEGARRRDGVCGSCNHRRLSATFSSIDRIALRRRIALAALPRGAQVSYGCSCARARPRNPLCTHVHTGGGRGAEVSLIPIEHAFLRRIFFSLLLIFFPLSAFSIDTLFSPSVWNSRYRSYDEERLVGESADVGFHCQACLERLMLLFVSQLNEPRVNRYFFNEIDKLDYRAVSLS